MHRTDVNAIRIFKKCSTHKCIATGDKTSVNDLWFHLFRDTITEGATKESKVMLFAIHKCAKKCNIAVTRITLYPLMNFIVKFQCDTIASLS